MGVLIKPSPPTSWREKRKLKNMATLDMRPASMTDGDAEVKEPEIEGVEGGEGADGGSSPPEKTQEDESDVTGEPDETEDGSTDGSDEAVSNTEVEEPEDEGEPEIERVKGALKKEREKLLAEIRELRSERRDLRQKKDQPLFAEANPDDLKDVSKDDVELIEKVLRAKGYVQKSEIETLTYRQQMDRYKDEWLDAHPEYKPENDPNDERWNALNGAVTAYFKTPQHPKDVKRILDMAHKMVVPEDDKKELPKRNRADADVAKKKLTVSSKGDGGGNAKSPAEEPVRGAPVNRGYFHGFNDEEIEELFG
jgi:hypothetical protein